ncbi:MAG TPA: cyclodeaminase/cyclohydrolase family protein [Polyangiales bacterium]|nr:cyclodeaminase/cyclohydrolase family protein [Polyangiales bacterium]
MSSSLWDWTLAQTRDATASASPTPGGGSIAAISGTFGLSLVVMALEITNKKAPSDTLASLLAEGRSLLDRLSAHADRDVELFERYLRAVRLPKATESESAARDSALSVATLEATEAPLMAAADQLSALSYAEPAVAAIQANVRSDVYAGADILLGAVHASLRNVDINLPHVSDEKQRAVISARADEIAAQSRALHARIVPAR